MTSAKKVSQFTEDTTPANSASVGFVDSGGTYRCTIEEMNRWAYGQISVTGGASGQALTIAGGYSKLTQFTANGLSLNTTPDHTNDQITVTDAGIYLVKASGTVEASNTSNVIIEARVGTTSQTPVVKTTCDGAAFQRCVDLSLILSLAASDVITLRAKVEILDVTVYLREFMLTVLRIA